MLIAGKQSNVNLSKAKVVNLYAKRGDTFSFSFTVKQSLIGQYVIDPQTQYLLDGQGNIVYDSDGQPVVADNISYLTFYSLTGTVIQGSIKKSKKSKEVIRLFKVNVNIINNSIILFLPAEDTLVPAGKYYYDVELYNIDTRTNTTILEGTITFSQDITDFIIPKEIKINFALNSSVSLKYIPKKIFDTDLNNLIEHRNIPRISISNLLTNNISNSIRFPKVIENGLFNTQITYSIRNMPYITVINSLTEKTEIAQYFAVNISQNALATSISYEIREHVYEEP